jgi:hypothetical protein
MSIIEKTTTPIGSYAPDFELLGIDEQVHHLYVTYNVGEE